MLSNRETASLAASLALMAVPSLQGQQLIRRTPPEPPPGPGLLNDWFRQKDAKNAAWDIGGQVRLRAEDKSYFATPGIPGALDFRANGNSENAYLLLREKIHLGYTTPGWSIFVEGRDSSAHGDERKPTPESDQFDLHQAYFTLGNKTAFPVTLKVGRQELAYGDERLVGVSDWSNVMRTFDAFKARYENDKLWAEAFLSRPVIVDDHNFNMSNEYEHLSGLYLSMKTVPKTEAQLYFLARNVAPGSPTADAGGTPQMGGASARDIYTFGYRIKSQPGQFQGWDFYSESASQFGRYKFTATGPSLDHLAYALNLGAGYTFANTATSPRFGLEYNYASGDSNPNDGTHETFDNLYPTNHRYYGFMDFVSWQNIHDLRLMASIKPSKTLTVTADYHLFMLASDQDAFYTVNGTARGPVNAAGRGIASIGAGTGYSANTSNGKFVGSEIDVIATYPMKSYLIAQAGYGHFFAGDYIADSLSKLGGAADADWFYVQLVFNF